VGEDFGIKLLATRVHHGLDLGDRDGLDLIGDIQVVLEVPAQVLLLPRGQGELDVGLGLELGLAGAAEPERDRILAVAGRTLPDLKRGHQALTISAR